MTVTEQLQAALTSRIVIEQAQGYVAAMSGTDPASAFQAIRRYARNHNQRIGETARAIVAGEIDPGTGMVPGAESPLGRDLINYLVERAAQFRTVLEASHDIISLHLVEDGSCVAVSPACRHILGYAPEQLLGRRTRDLVHPDDRYAVAAARARLLAGEPVMLEYRMLRNGGEPVWVESSARPPEPGGMIAIVTRDVTERHEWQELLMIAAMHDPVTGLANRNLFDESLDSELARIARHGALLAVLFIDLDNFKALNDRLGHLAGDKVLQHAADRISRHVRAGDVAARYGGDEFVVACVDLNSPAEAQMTAERMRDELARPYRIDDQFETVSASVGVAVWQPGMTPDQLVHAADQAMYSVKSRTITLPDARRPTDADQGI